MEVIRRCHKLVPLWPVPGRSAVDDVYGVLDVLAFDPASKVYAAYRLVTRIDPLDHDYEEQLLHAAKHAVEHGARLRKREAEATFPQLVGQALAWDESHA